MDQPFDSQKLRLKNRLLQDQFLMEGTNISYDGIWTEEVFLIGVFFLPFHEALRFLPSLFIEGKYNRYDLIYIRKIPKYIEDVKEFVDLITKDPDAETHDSRIHDVPVGTNYVFRQALILLVINGYT